MAKVIILAKHRPNGSARVYTQDQQNYMNKNHDKIPVLTIAKNLGLTYNDVYHYMKKNKLSIMKGKSKRIEQPEISEYEIFDIDIYFRDIATL